MKFLPWIWVKICQRRNPLQTQISNQHKYWYLQYTLSHPDHTKRSIVYRQTERINRIRFKDGGFRKHLT